MALPHCLLKRLYPGRLAPQLAGKMSINGARLQKKERKSLKPLRKSFRPLLHKAAETVTYRYICFRA
ncbi:MAG TPA: hypothetical protein PKY10_14870, partial [Lentisphaeria bacterium]|nr:hypothetical protein [Lentisphaeria bacterium]